MRKSICQLALGGLFLVATTTHAQEWKPVGEAFGRNDGKRPVHAVAPNGTVYVAYGNTTNSMKLNVLKADKWPSVGDEDFSAGSANALSMAVDNNNTPYVAYRDMSKGEKVVVQKFDGNAWKQLGTEVSDGNANTTSIAFDKNNTPFVAFTDHKNGNIAVKKLVNGNWTALPLVLANPGDNATIAFDANDQLYILYTDENNGRKAFMKKFDGTNWVEVGTSVSSKEAKYPSFGIDSKGNLFAAYQDAFNNNEVIGKKFNGKDWVAIGAPVFASSWNDNVSMAVSADGTPYVAYHSTIVDHDVEIKKFDGANWVDAAKSGKAGKGGDAYVRLQYKNNKLYVCFNADGDGGRVKELVQ